MTNKYFDERKNPQPGEPHYLCLSDLKCALDLFTCDEKVDVLDYGCGTSPYQYLFPHATYFRADLESNSTLERLDFLLEKNGKCSAPDRSFDIVLSTQVLEHVQEPKVYISECYRLLREGGRLLLTTHGTFPDHACPDDYYRWTLQGLANLIESEGFIVHSKIKITTKQRAFFYFFQQLLSSIYISRKKSIGILMWLCRRSILSNLVEFHKVIDTHYSGNRVVRNDFNQHPFYLCILVEAVK